MRRMKVDIIYEVAIRAHCVRIKFLQLGADEIMELVL